MAQATHLIHVAVEAATGRRSHVAVFGQDYATPDGTGVRDYIHVSDLADAHVDALEWLIAHPDESRVMNVGYGRGFSVLEVLDVADRVTGRKIERRYEPRRLAGVQSLFDVLLSFGPRPAPGKNIGASLQGCGFLSFTPPVPITARGAGSIAGASCQPPPSARNTET